MGVAGGRIAGREGRVSQQEGGGPGGGGLGCLRSYLGVLSWVELWAMWQVWNGRWSCLSAAVFSNNCWFVSNLPSIFSIFSHVC